MGRSEESLALEELLKRIPADQLAHAVGGLSERYKNLIFGATGFLGGAVLGAFAYHKLSKLTPNVNFWDDKTLNEAGMTPEEVNEVAQKAYKLSAQKSLEWMKEHNVTKDSRDGWTEQLAARYIADGGIPSMLPSGVLNKE